MKINIGNLLKIAGKIAAAAPAIVAVVKPVVKAIKAKKAGSGA